MSDDDLIRRGDARLIALEHIGNSMERRGALEAIRALPAVQPDAAAIREVVLSEAISHARQALVDAAHKYGGINVSKASAMFTAETHVTVALYRLMNNPGREADAAAIRNAALREASEIAAQEGWPSSMSDAEYEALTGSEEGGMDCATRIEAAILALIDNPGKEVMPLDAGTTETQTQAHDIGPGDQAVAGAAPVQMIYTNWRGETSRRMIIPRRVWFGSTDWHPEPQWLLKAIDTEKGEMRDFALKDFGGPVAPVTVQEAARVLLKWEAQQGAVFGACSGVVKVYRFNRVLESLAAVAQKGGE
jgi:hypothetical protein